MTTLPLGTPFSSCLSGDYFGLPMTSLASGMTDSHGCFMRHPLLSVSCDGSREFSPSCPLIATSLHPRFWLSHWPSSFQSSLLLFEFPLCTMTILAPLPCLPALSTPSNSQPLLSGFDFPLVKVDGICILSWNHNKVSSTLPTTSKSKL